MLVLLDLTRRAEPLMTGGGAIFAISYHGANEVIENEDPLPVASREVELEGSRPR